MDRLEKLRSDAMAAASDPRDDAEKAGERVGAVVDEFIAEHTVWPLEDGQSVWTGEPNVEGSTTYKRLPDDLLIIVPRKVPTLLEAAEAVEAWCRCTNHWRGMPAELHQKCDTLAAAIKKERSR